MNRKSGPILALSVALLLATSATATLAASEDRPATDLQARLTEFVGLVPGGAAALTIRDGVSTTAVAGIADASGRPVEPGTPFFAGPVMAPMDSAVVLRLVEEGLLDLDEPVATYLPDDPISPEATVRSLLTHRDGVPDVSGTMIDRSLADPSHRWTDEELVGLMDADATGSVGAFAPPGFTNTLLVRRLIAAATGADHATAFRTRISDPLGLEGTMSIDPGALPPPTLAAGWELALGQTGDLDVNGEAMWSISPSATTVGDVGTFLTALLDGRVLSDQSLQTMFDEDVARSGYGFERHEEYLGDLGDLGARYFVSGGGLPSGYNVDVAVAPSTGDIVVVLANNIELDTLGFVRDTVRVWAAEAPSSAEFRASAASGVAHFLVNFTCELGQRSVIELPDCGADAAGLRVTMSNPGERTGPFEGFQVVDAIAVVDPGDGSFSYSGLMTFAGSVEGCGTGTVFLDVAGEGFTDEAGVNTFTTNTLTVVTGGTIPVRGSIDESGPQVPQDDGTVTMAYTATYEC